MLLLLSPLLLSPPLPSPSLQSSTSDMRVALVHNPTEGTSQLLARAIAGALESQKIGRRGWNLVKALLEEGERGEGGTSIEDVLRVAGNVKVHIMSLYIVEVIHYECIKCCIVETVLVCCRVSMFRNWRRQ